MLFKILAFMLRLFFRILDIFLAVFLAPAVVGWIGLQGIDKEHIQFGKAYHQVVITGKSANTFGDVALFIAFLIFCWAIAGYLNEYPRYWVLPNKRDDALR